MAEPNGFFVNFLKDRADKGDVEACFRLFTLLTNQKEKIQYLRFAADKGHWEAAVVYGKLLIQTYHSEKVKIPKCNHQELMDRKRTIYRYLVPAVERGDVHACMHMACFMMDSRENFDDAEEGDMILSLLHHVATKTNDREANIRLAVEYSRLGLFKQAYEYLEYGSYSIGSSRCQVILGYYYVTGKANDAIPKDTGKGYALIFHSALNGNNEASFLLGNYHRTKGQYVIAYEWFARSFLDGHKEAQAEMEIMRNSNPIYSLLIKGQKQKPCRRRYDTIGKSLFLL